MITLPSLNSPLVDAMRRMKAPWNSFFQQFTQRPAPAMSVTVGSSPFSYSVLEPGALAIIGGTISAIHLFRGLVDINLTGTKIIPVGIGDVVVVTYSVLPTLTFMPSLGVAPQ